MSQAIAHCKTLPQDGEGFVLRSKEMGERPRKGGKEASIPPKTKFLVGRPKMQGGARKAQYDGRLGSTSLIQARIPPVKFLR